MANCGLDFGHCDSWFKHHAHILRNHAAGCYVAQGRSEARVGAETCKGPPNRTVVAHFRDGCHIRGKPRKVIPQPRDALLSAQERGIDERFTGMVLEGDMAANVRDPIYPAREVNLYKDEEKDYGAEAGSPEDRVFPGAQQVGFVTYSNKGHSVGKMLALGYLRTSHNFPGSRLVIQTNGRWIPATVTQTPFFDPGGLRLRA